MRRAWVGEYVVWGDAFRIEKDINPAFLAELPDKRVRTHKLTKGNSATLRHHLAWLLLRFSLIMTTV